MNGDNKMDIRLTRLEDGFVQLSSTVRELAQSNAKHSNALSMLERTVQTASETQENIEHQLDRVLTILDKFSGAAMFVKYALWLLGSLLAILVAIDALEHSGTLSRKVGELLRPMGISRTVSPQVAESSALCSNPSAQSPY